MFEIGAEEENQNTEENAKEKEFSELQKNIALTVEHIQGVFLVFGTGCGISFLAFIVECFAVFYLCK